MSATTLPIQARNIPVRGVIPEARGRRFYKLFGEADQDWRDDAKCVGCDPDWWFPKSSEMGRARKHEPGHAEQICATCPVRSECLAEARRTQSRSGIWGGVLVKNARPG